ncbi:MAG: hypothetical protein JO046_15735 [Solirubrobacterales bacterium]|nr:hypothetical protein [Solirubrobacterales bacterium]MBV9683238.1 hypothetical protein [Solirubrobacterales bacterium]
MRSRFDKRVRPYDTSSNERLTASDVPPLPGVYDALEPQRDEETVHPHYHTHHQAAGSSGTW